MTNDNVSEKKALIRFVVHHFMILVMAIIVVFAIGYGYMAVQSKATDAVKTPVYSERNAKAKAQPLPDFIVDKIKPDELELLKP